MKRFDLTHMLLLLLLAAGVWGVAACACLMVGSTQVGWPDRATAALRLYDHVLPASMIGAALACAGVAYQAILRNPLADPYLLGTSGGAMLAAYVYRLPAFAGVAWIAYLSPHSFALVGAVGVTTIVLLLAGLRGRINPVTAILVGAIINSLCGAAFILLNTIFRDLQGSGGVLTFLVGDIQTTASALHVRLSAIAIGFGWIILLMLSPALNVIRLSEDEAASLGVRVQRTRWGGLVVASAVTAAAVAISGPIGFVGLICPHVARWFCGNDNRRVMIVATALGASVLALADALSRYLLSVEAIHTVLPVGVITAILGGPFFLFILVRGRR